MAPSDLRRIAAFFSISLASLFVRFLMLDYVESSGKKRYYVCPVRKGDRTGSMADYEWAFSDAPCIFLWRRMCLIQKVKPRGGRTYYCGYVADTKRIMTRYSKQEAAADWSRTKALRQLVDLAVS